MNHSFTLNTLSSVLIAAMVYLFACLVDMHSIQINENVKNVQVLNKYGEVVSTYSDKATDIKVAPGEIIAFNVRYYSGHNASLQVTRYLVGPKGAKRELTSYSFKARSGDVLDQQVQYPIPLTAPQTCGYTVFSRIEITYPYNIITRITPIVKEVSRGASFCIAE